MNAMHMYIYIEIFHTYNSLSSAKKSFNLYWKTFLDMPSVLMKIGRSSLCRKLNLTMAVKTLGKDQKETRWLNVVRKCSSIFSRKA